MFRHSVPSDAVRLAQVGMLRPVRPRHVDTIFSRLAPPNRQRRGSSRHTAPPGYHAASNERTPQPCGGGTTGGGGGGEASRVRLGAGVANGGLTSNTSGLPLTVNVEPLPHTSSVIVLSKVVRCQICVMNGAEPGLGRRKPPAKVWRYR